MNVRLAAIFLAVMYAVFGVAAPSFSQNVTSGSISGVAVDQQNAVLPGVTIDAVHGPTGTHYSAVTDAEGRFFISSVRVGGPYTVTATLSGFRSQEQANVTVPLGETIALDFKLPLANVTETVTVEGEVDPVINPSRTGPAANVSADQLQNLPTVSRSLEDFARTSPYFSPIAVNAEPGAISVAGRNNRYNSIQIDGAVNNDLFGLSATGAPAGPDRVAADQHRRHRGTAAAGRAVRRAAGRILWRRRQRGDQVGHQCAARHGVLPGPFRKFRRQLHRSDQRERIASLRRVQREARRRQRRRADPAEPRVLLHQFRSEPAWRPVRFFGRRQLRCRLRPRRTKRTGFSTCSRTDTTTIRAASISSRAPSTTTSSSCVATSTSARTTGSPCGTTTSTRRTTSAA